jgi:peroxiredoxin
MNKIKAIFISVYSMGAMLASIHVGIQLFLNGINTAWLGALIAVLTPALFFARLFAKNTPRTSANLPFLIASGFVGLALTLTLPTAGLVPAIYAASFGALGSVLYVFWYSRINRNAATIKVGDILPDFTLYSSQKGANGETVASSVFRKQPSLLLFFRGNWCPLCMAQIKEIAASYQELDKRGVKVFLVSPQSEKKSYSLAKQFDAPMTFLVDRDLQAAKILGLVHENGTPAGILGYDSDSVMPTAILTDATGKIIFADLTDNYRVRPEPQTFIDILDQEGVVTQ